MEVHKPFAARLYLQPEGCERIVKGNPYWHWYITLVIADEEGKFAEPKNALLLGEAQFAIPALTLVAGQAVAGLSAELAELRAEAQAKATNLQSRINDLLALPAPGAEVL